MRQENAGCLQNKPAARLRRTRRSTGLGGVKNPFLRFQKSWRGRALIAFGSIRIGAHVPLPPYSPVCRSRRGCCEAALLLSLLTAHFFLYWSGATPIRHTERQQR